MSGAWTTPITRLETINGHFHSDKFEMVFCTERNPNEFWESVLLSFSTIASLEKALG